MLHTLPEVTVTTALPAKLVVAAVPALSLPGETLLGQRGPPRKEGWLVPSAQQWDWGHRIPVLAPAGVF